MNTTRGRRPEAPKPRGSPERPLPTTASSLHPRKGDAEPVPDLQNSPKANARAPRRNTPSDSWQFVGQSVRGRTKHGKPFNSLRSACGGAVRHSPVLPDFADFRGRKTRRRLPSLWTFVIGRVGASLDWAGDGKDWGRAQMACQASVLPVLASSRLPPTIAALVGQPSSTWIPLRHRSRSPANPAWL